MHNMLRQLGSHWACLTVAAVTWMGAASAKADVIMFETELLSLDLTGGPYSMPLASDPGNALGDSIEGYGFVDSHVRVTLSSMMRSLGMATATSGLGNTSDPRDGTPYRVDSFFDVFFDITVTDVDARAGRDYANMPDGATILLPNNGPAKMQNFYQVIFDSNLPNFGLIPPPQSAPYIGHFNIEIPLGGDINGNGENDKLKFTLATHAVGKENRTFIILPDGTVIDSFDSTADLSGAIVDESADPPFTIMGLSGPGSASSMLLAAVPEPSSLLLTLLGAGTVLAWRRRGKLVNA